MLIYLEKSGSTVAQYTKAMDDITQKNLFDGTITLSGGKTMNKIEFVKNYMGEANNLVEYYHKEASGKHYFLKYHPETNQGAVIVIDSYTKVIADTECRVSVNMTQQALQFYNEQKVNGE